MSEDVSQLLEKANITEDEYKKMYEEGLAQKIALGKSPEDAEKMAKRYVRRQLKRFAREKTDLYKGFFIGATPLTDRLDILRRAAVKQASYGAEEAIAAGFINRDGLPLDTRKLVFGRPNPNLGSPIKGDAHEYFRNFWGIASKDEVFNAFKLEAYGEQATKLDVSFLAPVIFTALTKGVVGPYTKLRAGVRSLIRSDGREYDFKKLVTEKIPRVSLGNAINALKLNPKQQIVSFLSGDVVLLKETNGRSMIRLDDESLTFDGMNATAFYPGKLPASIVEDERVAIFGRPYIRTWREIETLNIETYSIYLESEVF